MRGLVFVFAATLGLCEGWCLLKYPKHASCDVDWEVGVGCGEVGRRLKAQMLLWEDRSGCPLSGANGTGETLGERCLYTFRSMSGGRIEGYHHTPVESYRDTFHFELTADGEDKCKVKGFSSSDTWYAFLDLGTNYCNLANLVFGAGLNGTQGFKEETENCRCTQYTSRDCDKY